MVLDQIRLFHNSAFFGDALQLVEGVRHNGNQHVDEHNHQNEGCSEKHYENGVVVLLKPSGIQVKLTKLQQIN